MNPLDWTNGGSQVQSENELPRGKPRGITMMNLIDLIASKGEQIETTPCLPLF